jgi:surface antigen
MKKQWILGALVAATGLQSAPVANAQSKQGAGQILGAIAGGLIGNQIGGGNGKVAATAIGAAVGLMVGGRIGRDMDEEDRRAYAQAQSYCFRQGPNSSREWSGRNANGTFRTTRQGYHTRTREVCNEYSSSIYMNGRTENSSGIACQRSDGSYYEVNQSEVRFDGGSSYDPYPQTNSDSYDSDTGSRRYNNQYNNHYDDRSRGYGRDRHRSRDRDDRYNGYPPAPGQGGITYPAPPPTQLPPPPAGYPGYPGSQQGSASIRIPNLVRDEGGAWYRITFDRSVAISNIQFQALEYGLRVYNTTAITENGVRMIVPELSTGGMMYPNASAAGFVNRQERILAIDIRAEAMGGPSDLAVYFRSPEAMPGMRIQRF